MLILESLLTTLKLNGIILPGTVAKIDPSLKPNLYNQWLSLSKSVKHNVQSNIHAAKWGLKGALGLIKLLWFETMKFANK